MRGICLEDFVDLLRQPHEMLQLVAATPAAALGATRDKPQDTDGERLLDVFRKHDVRYFFYIGGNDSAQVAQIVNRWAVDCHYDMRVIHIPKTIDNDLLANDHCPGYGSAAKFVATAFIGDNLDNRALPGVKINILMGRDAGFITAASVLARQREDDGPHLIYVPERPFSMESFVEDVSEIVDRFGRCIIAVSEGIRDESGDIWAAKINRQLERDSFGNIQLSGTGALADYLAGTIKERLHPKVARVRADTYGYLQRSFPLCISDVDAWEARLVGQMAVSYSVDADRDGSVALVRLPGASYAVGTQLVPLEAVAPISPPFTKLLPEKYISRRSNYIDHTFLTYVGPLIGQLPKVGWFEQIATERLWG
jgi:6-phosphofructokinase